jgi:hypothetical protein
VGAACIVKAQWSLSAVVRHRKQALGSVLLPMDFLMDRILLLRLVEMGTVLHSISTWGIPEAGQVEKWDEEE